jgi:flagellar basal body P-ring protein FlgI
MTPHYAQVRLSFFSPQLILLVCLVVFCGCTSTAIRSQSPEDGDLAGDEAQTELIGDVASPYGLHYVTVQAPALVTGLKDTGSDPPPSAARSALENDMQARGVHNIKKILASHSTSLVWVRAHLPPGVQKGDPLDLEVRALPDSETTDLSGGWVMPTRLREKALLNNIAKDGHEWAVAQGAILVDPLMQSGQDPTALTRGRVLSGAQATKSRNLWLILKRDKKSVPLSKKVGDALNRRFHTFTQGSKQGIATPLDDEKIEIVLHSRYRHNIPRYISVLRSVAVYETAAQQLARLERLERQLLDPFTSATAALRLEAIGKPAIDVLRKGLAAKDAEVRFYSAEALAYLDDSQAAAPLADAARNEPAFRVFALTALSTMEDVAAADELRSLLDVPSAETRYGAFRALWGMNRDDPLVKGEQLHGKLTLHVIPTTAPPLVHVTRSVRPEVVLFGQDQYLQTPFTLEAGKSTVVKATTPDRVVISRFALGEPDRELVTSSRVEDVIRAVIEAGGHYPDVVQLLHAARLQGALAGRFEVEAIPQAGRNYDRPPDGDKQDADRSGFEVLGSLPNLFGRRAADPSATDDSTTDGEATPSVDGSGESTTTDNRSSARMTNTEPE